MPERDRRASAPARRLPPPRRPSGSPCWAGRGWQRQLAHLSRRLSWHWSWHRSFCRRFCLVIAVGFYIGDLEIVGSLANFTRLSRFYSFVSFACLASLADFAGLEPFRWRRPAWSLPQFRPCPIYRRRPSWRAQCASPACCRCCALLAGSAPRARLLPSCCFRVEVAASVARRPARQHRAGFRTVMAAYDRTLVTGAAAAARAGSGQGFFTSDATDGTGGPPDIHDFICNRQASRGIANIMFLLNGLGKMPEAARPGPAAAAGRAARFAGRLASAPPCIARP